jgi:hypothetical protein
MRARRVPPTASRAIGFSATAGFGRRRRVDGRLRGRRLDRDGRLAARAASVASSTTTVGSSPAAASLGAQALSGHHARGAFMPGPVTSTEPFVHRHGQRRVRAIPAGREARARDADVIAPGAICPARVRAMNDRDLDRPSSIATVAPCASSASTCACARGGSVTCEPSEKRSDSGAASGAASCSPTAPGSDRRRAVDRERQRLRPHHEDRDPGRAQRRARQRQPPRPCARCAAALVVQRSSRAWISGSSCRRRASPWTVRATSRINDSRSS